LGFSWAKPGSESSNRQIKKSHPKKFLEHLNFEASNRIPIKPSMVAEEISLRK
jgi:hypothetical protein